MKFAIPDEFEEWFDPTLVSPADVTPWAVLASLLADLTSLLAGLTSLLADLKSLLADLTSTNSCASLSTGINKNYRTMELQEKAIVR